MRAIRRWLCWPLRYKVNTKLWRVNSVKPMKNGIVGGSAVGNLRVKLKGYAKEIGLDVDKFDKTMDDKSIADLLHTDQKHAFLDLRMVRTPEFTVNDKILENIDYNKVLENVESSTPAEYLVKEFKKAAGLSWFVRFG